MDALVMCGGRGTRFDASGEKPLVEIGGQPMVERVIGAVAESSIDETFATVTPHTPNTREFVVDRGVPVIDTAGAGYVADLTEALEGLEPPLLTVAADLPLLEVDLVNGVIADFDGPSVTVAVPVVLKQLLGLSVGVTTSIDGRRVAPTGLNIVSAQQTEKTIVSYDVRVAVNVNTRADATIAERLV